MSHKDKLRVLHDEAYPNTYPKANVNVLPVPGAIAVSRAGRDRHRAFLVLGVRVAEPFEKSLRVFVADGSLRRTDAPKVKNISHLVLTGMSDEAASLIAQGKLTDADARRILAQSESAGNKTI